MTTSQRIHHNFVKVFTMPRMVPPGLRGVTESTIKCYCSGAFGEDWVLLTPRSAPDARADIEQLASSMPLRNDIAQRAREHGERLEVAERTAIGAFQLSASVRCDDIEKALNATLSRVAVGRLWVRIRHPNYSAAITVLEHLVSDGREAHTVLARQRDEGPGDRAVTSEVAVASRNQLVALVNRCEALRAYAHSMGTGEFAAHRKEYLNVYFAMKHQEGLFMQRRRAALGGHVDPAMNVQDTFARLGGFLIMGAFLVVGLAIAGIFVFGAAWASTKLLPWLSVLTWIAFGLVVFILLPLTIPRATRGLASIALFIASYVFGATLWMEGLLLTLTVWGVGAVFIGLFLAGVGVVPIAMLAALFKGMWGPGIELVVLTLLTFGTRVGAMSLAESLEG